MFDEYMLCYTYMFYTDLNKIEIWIELISFRFLNITYIHKFKVCKLS